MCIRDRTKLEAYSRPRVNGINAITIKENDRLLDVKLTNGDNHIIIAKRSGKAINLTIASIPELLPIIFLPK